MNDIKEDFFSLLPSMAQSEIIIPGTEYKLMFNFDLQIYQLIKF